MKGAGEQQSGSPITDAALPALFMEQKLVFRLVMMHGRGACNPRSRCTLKSPRHKPEQQQPSGQSTVYNSAICLYLFLIKVLQ